MFENSNNLTQPSQEMPVFNNWRAVAEGWYCVGTEKEFTEKNIFSSRIGFQELVIFRTSDGKVHCLDAFCSHLGLRLSTGSVVKDHLRCQFHHWAYNGKGEASDSACRKLSDSKKLRSYPVEVRYGLIWIWPGEAAKYPLPSHPDLGPGAFSFKLGKSYTRPSHPHISLLNALDIQHVNTVHALELNVTCTHHEAPDSSYIHYDFEGEFLKNSASGRRNAALTGGGYKFSVRYSASSIGFLKALEGIRMFGKLPFPSIYATFGYRQIENKYTIIQPVFLCPLRKGFFGKLRSWFQLKLTEVIYNKLKNEDGEIYENIRFTPNLTSEDKAIGSFINYVNRLQKSPF